MNVACLSVQCLPHLSTLLFPDTLKPCCYPTLSLPIIMQPSRSFFWVTGQIECQRSTSHMTNTIQGIVYVCFVLYSVVLHVCKDMVDLLLWWDSICTACTVKDGLLSVNECIQEASRLAILGKGLLWSDSQCRLVQRLCVGLPIVAPQVRSPRATRIHQGLCWTAVSSCAISVPHLICSVGSDVH